jgi:hypothetical protein
MLPLNPSRGDTQIDLDKIERDIAFLTDRIAAMKLQPRPNQPLIAHYEGMLTSRTAVLKWLLDAQMARSAQIHRVQANPV